MPITAALDEFLNSKEWDDSIEINEDKKTSIVDTEITIDGVKYRMIFEATEINQWMEFYLYFPIPIPGARINEAYKLINAINARIGVGRLVVTGKSTIQYKAIVDLEGSQATGNMYMAMLGAGTSMASNWGSIIGKFIYTNLSTDELLEEMEE